MAYGVFLLYWFASTIRTIHYIFINDDNFIKHDLDVLGLNIYIGMPVTLKFSIFPIGAM